MKCPNCNAENNEGAKFCKKCGTPLKNNTIDHESMIKSMSNEKSDNTTKIIIVALIVVVVALAGVFIYLQSAGHQDSQAQDASAQSNASSSSSQPVQSTTTESTVEPEKTAKSSNSMKIEGGSFYTGSEESDKTYASIYLGKQHAGEDVIVQIWYSRDGNTLNHGNMVPVTVHSDGYVELTSADAYHYYPDYATINLYDSNSNLLDSQSVSLSPTSGTQTF